MRDSSGKPTAGRRFFVRGCEDLQWIARPRGTRPKYLSHTTNSYEDFLTEVTQGDIIIDRLIKEADNYLDYCYRLFDKDLLPLNLVESQSRLNGVLAKALSADVDKSPDEGALAGAGE